MAEAKKKNPLVPFLSGGMAGIAEITVTMPLDTIKTQMQLRSDGSGAVSIARGIVAKNGPRGLYFGMSAMLTQVSCKAAIRFAAFEQFKLAMKTVAPGAGDVQTNFLCGIGAGIAEAAIWVTPTERLKVLRQAEVNVAVPKYGGSLAGSVKTVVAEQGVRGLFVGFVPTAARQGLAMGVRFMLYDIVKKKIVQGDRKATPIESLVAGMATGTISSLLNQPLDMAKSRLQAQDKGAVQKYTGTLQTLMMTAKEEGVMSWYRGCVPRVARLTIGQGIIFSVQEHIAEALRSVLG